MRSYNHDWDDLDVIPLPEHAQVAKSCYLCGGPLIYRPDNRQVQCGRTNNHFWLSPEDFIVSHSDHLDSIYSTVKALVLIDTILLLAAIGLMAGEHFAWAFGLLLLAISCCVIALMMGAKAHE